MLFLSDSPYLKLLSYIVSTIIKAFIMGHQFLHPLLTECGRLWPPLTTDGRPLRGSSCTLSRPLLNFLTHFLTIPSLMAFSPYTSHIWQWISAGFTFLAFKKRIRDRISQLAGRSIILKILNTQQYANTICFSCIGVCGLPMNEGRQDACAKSLTQRCSGNIRKRYLLSEYASIHTKDKVYLSNILSPPWFFTFPIPKTFTHSCKLSQMLMDIVLLTSHSDYMQPPDT